MYTPPTKIFPLLVSFQVATKGSYTFHCAVKIAREAVSSRRISKYQSYIVVQRTLNFPSFVPGVHENGFDASKTISKDPFVVPENWILALSFADFVPTPAPISKLSGLIVYPPPRPKSFEPAWRPPRLFSYELGEE